MTAQTFPATSEADGLIQITAAQRRAMAWASDAVASWTCDGAMSFRIYSQQGNGDVMFCATNVESHDHEWFMPALSAYIFISKGGSIRRVTGSWRLYGSSLRLRRSVFAAKKPAKVVA